jgi:N-acetylglucosaminyldiphosphoundecaprenol N-acetyl-beta-D-mannosaminyltransferase
MTSAAPLRSSVLGTQVTPSTFDEAIAWLDEAVRAGRGTFMSPANAYSVMLGREKSEYRDQVNRAGYVMADGMSVVWALRLLGASAERVHGDDLFLAYCERFPKRRHFLLGGAEGQPERVAAFLRAKTPALEIAGCRATPRRPIPNDENQRILESIRAARAELVWVGMGTPAQDEWMAANAGEVKVPMVGVGSAFDLLAGNTRAAPKWMKENGLQWLFRLAQEPRRLGRRYLVYNPLFVWHVGRQVVAEKRKSL